MRSFGYKALSLGIVSALTATTATAAGLDRSGQDVTAFLQNGTYAETVYTYVDADVSGTDKSGNATGGMAESYDFFRFGVKADVNDRVSVGVLYDEPFGAAVQYMGDNNFVSAGADATISSLTAGRVPSMQAANTPNPAMGGMTAIQAAQFAAKQLKPAVDSGIATQAQVQQYKDATGLLSAAAVAATSEAQKGQGTNVEIRTNNVTALMGVKLGANRNFQIYGGPAAQRLNGEVHLRGTTYQDAQGYDARIATDITTGWVAGVAYMKPEIALKAALTYRSETEHESSIAETFPALGATTGRDFSVTLPESYNFDFQTGVNPTTLLTAKVRYVPWSDFEIRPPTYGDATARTNNGTPLPILSYAKDQWSAEVGVGKKLSDKLAVSGNIGWDSGAGNPATSLGPIEGYYSVGLGAKYNFTPEWSASLGAKYLKFGDATAQLPNGADVGEFTKNDGYIAGVRLAYQGK